MKYIVEDEKKALLSKIVEGGNPVDTIIAFVGGIGTIFEISHSTPLYKYLSIAFEAVANNNDNELQRLKSKFDREMAKKENGSVIAAQLFAALDETKNMLVGQKEQEVFPIMKEHIDFLAKRLQIEKDKACGELLRQKAMEDVRKMKEGKGDVQDWESCQFLRRHNNLFLTAAKK